jgi:hypothetical protein
MLIFYKKAEKFSFGSKKSKKTEILRETINETLMESFMSVTTSCQNKIEVNQNIELKCNPSDDHKKIANDKMKMCYDLLKAQTPYLDMSQMKDYQKECMKAGKACILTDIKQEATVNFSSSCSIDSKMTSDVQDKMLKTLTDRSQNSTDGFTDALNGAVDGLAKMGDNVTSSSFGGSSKEDLKDTTKVLNKLTQSVSQEMLQELANSFSVNQDIKISGDDTYASGISQKAQLDIVTELMSKNEVMNDLVKAVDLSEVDESVNENKGVTDVVDSFTTMFSNPWVIAGLVCCVVVMLIVGLMAFNKKTNAAMSMSPMSMMRKR